MLRGVFSWKSNVTLILDFSLVFMFAGYEIFSLIVLFKYIFKLISLIQFFQLPDGPFQYVYSNIILLPEKFHSL